MNNNFFKFPLCFFVLKVFFFSSCDKQDQTDAFKSSLQTNELNDSTEENSSSRKEIFIAKLMEDFQKPLHTYPRISNEESFSDSSGIVFRKGIEEPFTGRIVEYHKNGNISLDASYLDGVAHGIQAKYFESGVIALEAIFNKGILEGAKTRWWENGTLREEEYWNEGKYTGRKLWDNNGRLLREELVRTPSN